ncbi:MAG: redoxin domain-containing protein [Candidatus Diapherotrites archaeon]|uniref:Redoxin domain-containing protein n=1 Tax=Candidatus Iainarchaeum sp. TaxID=3101447 RepID=A0A7J4IT09_9ARCH|nr:MAG: thiol-disulfide isomerase [archaeon GW2011_AR10]MBS3059023.1 redoxin domain-containing protein [Candidatus Diapherotrites archaeon]HIH08658.1 redoxin domain-containing protein [Candidatus Diapherotrites archaeon]
MDETTRKILLAVVVVAVIGAIVFLENPFQQNETVLPEVEDGSENAAEESSYPVAPEIIGIHSWINSQELKLADLRGKVVLVDFWTYSCVNCLRTLPHLREWNEKYSGLGFVLIGVHSPEFNFEKELANVQQAVNDNGIEYAVALDNDMKTWRNYKNRFWPAKYLIDANGRIRYTHFGEGAYAETEKQIQLLLEEARAEEIDIEIVEEEESGGGAGIFRTPELYAGYAFGSYLGNSEGYAQDAAKSFTAPAELADGKIYLNGEWFNSSEHVRHARKTQNLEDFIAIKYLASEVNAVLQAGPEPYKVYVMLDGKDLKERYAGSDIMWDDDGNAFVVVDKDRLYNIIDGPLGIRELRLSSDSDEFTLYTFTFGG